MSKNFFETEKINLLSDKMYPLSTASAIIGLLSNQFNIKKPYGYIYDCNLKEKYLNFFLKTFSGTKETYISYMQIEKAIPQNSQSELKWPDINEAVSIAKIQSIAYLLLIDGYPDNIEEKYYSFNIGKDSRNSKKWRQFKFFCNSCFNDPSIAISNTNTNLLTALNIISSTESTPTESEETTLPLPQAIYCIMYLIMPQRRPYEFTLGEITNISEQISLARSDNIKINYAKEATDSFRVQVNTEKPNLAANLGLNIQDYKRGNKFCIPINVATELVAYFSYKDKTIYQNIIKGQALEISQEEKTNLLNHFNNVVGHLFKHVFCYNYLIQFFPYEPCSSTKCNFECKNEDNDCYNYFNILKSRWSAKLDFVLQVNQYSERISKLSQQNLERIMLASLNNDKYLALPDFYTHYFFDYDLEPKPSKQDQTDEPPHHKKNKPTTSYVTYFEQLFLLQQLQNSLSEVYNNWLKEVDDFQQYKRKDWTVEIDYANWYKYQFYKNDLYIQRFQEDPESFVTGKVIQDPVTKKIKIILYCSKKEAHLLSQAQKAHLSPEE